MANTFVAFCAYADFKQSKPALEIVPAQKASEAHLHEARWNPTADQFKKIHSSLSIQELDEQIVATAYKMSIVYTAICAFENTVRSFIAKKLLETKGETWWQIGVSDKIRA